MAPQPGRHWLALLDAAEIPCGPINDYAQVFADPQVAARGMMLGPITRFSAVSGRSDRRSS